MGISANDLCIHEYAPGTVLKVGKDLYIRLLRGYEPKYMVVDLRTGEPLAQVREPDEGVMEVVPQPLIYQIGGKQPKVRFGDLKPGKCFQYKAQFFIKITKPVGLLERKGQAVSISGEQAGDFCFADSFLNPGRLDNEMVQPVSLLN